MALEAGTVDGTGAGTGLAKAIFDVFAAHLADALEQTGFGDGVANLSTGLAAAIVGHFTANAEITPGTFEAGGDPVTGAATLS